jgi:hypothetical protein
MKLLVFAHTPPPHHGQSYMVQLMLAGFGGDARRKKPVASQNRAFGIECYHVNARFSRGLEDVGEFQGQKFSSSSGFACRPSGPVSLRREKFLLRARARQTRRALPRLAGDAAVPPVFQNVILHWHAAGLAKWLETATTIRTRAPHLPAVPAGGFEHRAFALQCGRRGKTAVAPRMCVVNNGIPDPCPDLRCCFWPTV